MGFQNAFVFLVGENVPKTATAQQEVDVIVTLKLIEMEHVNHFVH